MYVPDWCAKELESWRTKLPALEQTLGYRFRERARLQEALTHRSFAHESRDPQIRHYERLEFLGDAVLELVVTQLLMERFPTLPEGDLTRLRAELVKKRTLAQVGRSLALGAVLLLGKGERQRGGAERASILADVVEALLGAVFLDGGISAARLVCLRLLRQKLQKLDPGKLSNHKNRLQELAASRQLPAPKYRLLATEGPKHRPTFVMMVEIEPGCQATGRGPSKKAATQEAARQLLLMLQREESAAHDSHPLTQTE